MKSCALWWEMQYDRNDLNFERGTFRVRGDVVEIFPIGSSEHAIRVEFSGMKSTVLRK